MLLYKFYLNGTEVENPDSWDEMITTVRRDRILKGVFVTLDATFTFRKDGFTLVWDTLQTDGYCAEIELQILESRDAGNNYYLFYDGIIKISDVEFMGRQINLEPTIVVEQYAKCKVLDNSFFSKILNNRTLKTNLCAGKSKNGVDITPCVINAQAMFDPADGVFVGLTQPYESLKPYDVFKYLIDFMTDGEIDFDSTLFGAGGEFEFLVLSYGYPIRKQGFGIFMTKADFIRLLPELDFQTYFKEMNARCNIGLFIDNTGSKPKVRIEKYDDLFLSNSLFQISNIDRLVTRIKVEEIYSKLKIGSTTTLNRVNLQFPEDIRFIGFSEEEYIIVGDCNIDSTLDLTGDFLVSSNDIEQILINDPTDTSYDDKFFLIDSEFQGVQICRALKSNWLLASGPPYYYNERLINSNISNRFLRAVPNDIAAYLGNVDNRFQAMSTSDFSLKVATAQDIEPAAYQNDSTGGNFDTAGNYDNTAGNYRYTAPQAGVYTFQTISLLSKGYYPNANPPQKVYFRRYDVGGILLQQFLAVFIVDQFITPYTFTQTMVLNATDYVDVAFEGFLYVLSDAFIMLHEGSTFSCIQSADGGGVFRTYDPADYPIITDSFDQELEKGLMDLIIANPLSLIEYSQGSQSYKFGWIDEIKYDHFKGMASYKMLTTKTGDPNITVPKIVSYMEFYALIPSVPFTVDKADLFGRRGGYTNDFRFYNQGDVVTITIPDIYLGHNAGNDGGGIKFYVRETHPVGPDIYLQSLTNSITITISPDTAYYVSIGYDIMTPAGNVYAPIYGVILPPPAATIILTTYAGTTLADYTYLWTHPDLTTSTGNGIAAAVKGKYTCRITYIGINPPAGWTNAVTQIPVTLTFIVPTSRVKP